KITNNKPKSAGTNLYQELDLAIDEYLEHQDISYINKAREIATDIDTKYGDKYGVDLVSYYQTISNSQKKNLLIYRKKFVELSNQPSGDNYEHRLKESEKLKSNFFSLGNTLETYKINTLIAKLHVKLLKYKIAEIVINDGLNFADKHNYLFLKGHFLLWQAKNLSELSDFSLAESVFKETIKIGEVLKIEELLISPGMTLAAIYLKNDDNKKALKTVEQVLNNYSLSNIEHTISLLQIGGVSAFNLKLYNLSEGYFHDAITLSKKHSNSYALIMSYTFYGVTLAQAQRFEKAEEAFEKAKEETKKIQEEASRLNVSSITLGYQAKAKLLAGQFTKAIELYKETLAIIDKLEITNTLEAGQIQEGLAIALEKIGREDEAKQHITIAKHYQELAASKEERANCLLSFMPNICNTTR
ncbi:MAG: hypothetical protein HY819_00235, partial [Acidobacteria bacterium]|nr:hypothetical protein [Acidobacteriota bacterium]